LENNEQQKEGLITPCIALPVNSIIEVGLGLSKASKADSVHSFMNPKKVPETRNIMNLINPETSSISTSNHIPEIFPVTPSLGPLKKSNKFLKRKIAYGCNHCDIMLISQNLIKKHLQRKHEQN